MAGRKKNVKEISLLYTVCKVAETSPVLAAKLPAIDHHTLCERVTQKKVIDYKSLAVVSRV